MFLRFEENPNCGFVDDRVWKEEGEPRRVTSVLRRHGGEDVWCPVTGLDGDGQPIPATGIKVQDSGEGTCWLIYGGLWGLRLKAPTNDRPWSLEDSQQWAEPFLLLPPNGADLRFAS